MLRRAGQAAMVRPGVMVRCAATLRAVTATSRLAAVDPGVLERIDEPGPMRAGDVLEVVRREAGPHHRFGTGEQPWDDWKGKWR